MKNFYGFILMAGLMLLGIQHSQAQSRKYISQFSHFQNYYNPGLTGYEGSVVRGFVRNQWAGFDDAPKTMFFSVELDLAELGNNPNPDLTGKSAIGLGMMYDQYGPFDEAEFILSYASRIRLTTNTNLRLGAGVNYGNVRLDGHRITTRDMDDPATSAFLNTFARMSTLDFNVGLALTHRNYYLSYGAHNVNRGGLNRGDVFWENRPMTSIVQAGYRQVLNEDLTIISNFMYRSQADLPVNLELNLKALMMDRFWVGGGHRVNYANNLQLGFLFPKLIFGYVYELPMNKSYLLPSNTHEFMLTVNLFRTNVKRDARDGVIW